uniref:Uncharacterized protein n=1 Tax=Rhizobium meliloti TaxID=382 RepID=A0A0D4DCW9_RHIML|nr:hypothetical protein [Sinorhizobium meliloti]
MFRDEGWRSIWRWRKFIANLGNHVRPAPFGSGASVLLTAMRFVTAWTQGCKKIEHLRSIV